MLPFQVPRLTPTGLVESGLNVVSWAVIFPAPVTAKGNVVAPLSVNVLFVELSPRVTEPVPSALRVPPE